MKVYIAARFTEKETVRNIYDRLKALGYGIASDWTLHKNIKPYEQHEVTAGEYSEEDINGALDCDVFILLTSDQPGTGVSTELGAALANRKQNGKPRIYIVGDYRNRSAFHYHPFTIWKQTIDEVFDELTTLKR